MVYQYFIDLNSSEIINIPSLKINLELESIRQIIDHESDLYMTASVQNIMVDSLNRYLMKVGKN